jgi:anaerobic ribonucleoside-triphosphate reductase activating protein
MSKKIQLAGYLYNSLVNGEGARDVVFFSGCTHKCEGCHNEALQDFKYGAQTDIEDIISVLEKGTILCDGVTISGGDPFFQYQGLFELCKRLKENGYNIWVYTGFTMEEIKSSLMDGVLEYIDVLVDGKFKEDNMEDAPRYAGSNNQRIIRLR